MFWILWPCWLDFSSLPMSRFLIFQSFVLGKCYRTCRQKCFTIFSRATQIAVCDKFAVLVVTLLVDWSIVHAKKIYNYHSVLLSLFYQVCKKMFLLTLDISQSMFVSSLKSYRGEGHKISKAGNRGGNTRTPDDIILAVTDHINSFPWVCSHISGE